MPLVIQILGLADGSPTVFDGQYLKEYDPNRDGVDPSGQPMLAHVACTDDPAAALHFEDAGEAHRVWTLVDQRDPVRPDGKPNRPLTAFTITIIPAP
jgi:hypothetical protein